MALGKMELFFMQIMKKLSKRYGEIIV